MIFSKNFTLNAMLKAMSLLCMALVLSTALAGKSDGNHDGDGDVGYFLHVTDTHTDLRYTVGAPQHCMEDDTVGGIGCCHASDHASTSKPSPPATKWGAFNCDASPFWTESVFAWMAANLTQSVDFIIHTGDFASHHDLTQTPWENAGAVSLVTRYMADAFPGTPLLNVMGNHDGWPVDNTIPGIEELMLANISLAWTPFLEPGVHDTIAKGGYYSYRVAPGLRFISLNILWWDTNNFIHKKESVSPDYNAKDMWTWLNDTLAQARSDGEKVWIGHHFGPGMEESSEGFSVRLTQFYDDFKDVIQQAFCGHTHTNEFYLFNTADGRLVQSCWAPGSLYTSGHNPQFNVYKYNTSDFAILDFDHYECDLNTTIATNSPACSLAYSFGEAYGENTYNTEALGRLYGKLGTNDTVLQYYYRNKAPGASYDNPHPDSHCDEACKAGLLRSTSFKPDKPYVPGMGMGSVPQSDGLDQLEPSVVAPHSQRVGRSVLIPAI